MSNTTGATGSHSPEVFLFLLAFVWINFEFSVQQFENRGLHLSVGHSIICPSNYSFWLPLWYLLITTLVSSHLSWHSHVYSLVSKALIIWHSWAIPQKYRVIFIVCLCASQSSINLWKDWGMTSGNKHVRRIIYLDFYSTIDYITNDWRHIWINNSDWQCRDSVQKLDKTRLIAFLCSV